MSYRPGGQNSDYTEPISTPSPPESFSLIDRHSAVEGTYTTSRDLRIEGEMRGTLRCEGLLYVADGADVDATVEAANITVAGQLRGEVSCRGKLQIMPTGRVTATVNTESLVINEGAFYEGDLRMEFGDGTSALTTGHAEHGEMEPEDGSAALLRRFAGEQGESPPLSPPSGRRSNEG